MEEKRNTQLNSIPSYYDPDNMITWILKHKRKTYDEQVNEKRREYWRKHKQEKCCKSRSAALTSEEI